MIYNELQKMTVTLNSEQGLWNFIFSEFSTTPGFKLNLESGQFYVYQTIDELVCVLLDKGNNTEAELVDEKPFEDEEPLYFSGTGHRVSPVYRIWQVMHLLKKQLMTDNVYGVLLTDSSFIHDEDFHYTWDRLGISVKENLKSIPDSLPYNEINMDNELDVDNLPTPVDYGLEIEDIMFEKSLEEELLKDTEESEFESEDEDFDSKGEFTWKDLVEEGDHDFFEYVLDKKIPKPILGIKILKPLDNPEEELNRMVGLDDIKSRLKYLSYLVIYNKQAQKLGLKVNSPNLHSVFIGGPGTGKTTMAQIIGSYFKNIGLLSKGHTIVTSRGSYTGKLWGSEEENVRKILKLSQGGVLLIDEAYLLYNADEPRDPCNKILPLMLDLLTDERNRDIIVILCGYEKEMNFLLNSNPGIKGRFRNYFYFKDFSNDELSEIMYRRTADSGYKFSDNAWIKVLNIINRNLKHSECYANARDVINLWEEILEIHACRCVMNKIVDLQGISLITDEDIP